MKIVFWSHLCQLLYMRLFVLPIVVFLFFGNMFGQQTDFIDFKKAEAHVSVESDATEVKGSVSYTFDVMTAVDSLFLDAKHMKFTHVVLMDDDLEELIFSYKNTGEKLNVYFPFEASNTYKLFFNYSAKPKKALYFIDNQVWTQGQGKYTSNWLPSLDDANDKIEFDLRIITEAPNQVIANGNLFDLYQIEKESNFFEWHYDMQKPMSSYLVAFVIGNYKLKSETSNSGIPLEYYYYPEDSLKVEPTYRYTKQMFDFLEEEIGFPYPWQNFKQVPVRDFLYSGMENTSLTIFSDSFVVDSIAYNDKNYFTVNAHELAHQWFGNMVTATSNEHHWLQEGFATYYALLAERNIFGENHYYWQLFENAQELIAQESAGQSTSLLDPKSSSTTFYKKGAWALHELREQVGDSAFQIAVKTYLEKHQFANVETDDFMSEVEQASRQDLTDFVNTWLVEKTLPEDAMVKSLKRSPFMQEYFMVNCETDVSKCKAYLRTNISDKAKIKIISQVSDQIDASAFQNSLKVRQAIARYVDKIPMELKSEYETLLDDKSYLTIENALYHLWANFPVERVKYLQKTKNIVGFNDFNVRLLWLALHLNTAEFQPENKQQVLNEMIGYSLPNHHFELRQNAFNYLKLIGGFETESIKSLLDASKHHNWRFSKYAKTILSELEQEPAYKAIIETLKLNKS